MNKGKLFINGTIACILILAILYITFDIKEWIENFAHERARVAIDDMIKNLVEHCNANEIALSVGRPAQIQQAVALGLATKIQAPDTDLKG